VIGMYSCSGPAATPAAKNTTAVTDSSWVVLNLVTLAVAEPVQLSAPADSAGRMFITDHKGRIWILKKDSILPRPFFNIVAKTADKLPVKGVPNPLNTINSIAFHPQFARNHKFYVCYNAATRIKGNKTKLVVDEFTADDSDPDTTAVKSMRHVFELEGKMMFTNGTEIAFGPDGYLYISIGDDAFGDSTYVYHAQDMDYLNGKLLRIDVNKTPYGIPADNPYAAKPHVRPEIWASGFRKMWRFCFDPKSKQLFGADVGEKKREEIDLITKAGNYGWPAMEGDTVYNGSTAGTQQSFSAPINTYSHKEGICVIGGCFYYGAGIPFLADKYVFADFKGILFSLSNNGKDQWLRSVLNVRNQPAEPFLVCGLNAGNNKELYVMGMLNSKTGPKGVVYKIIKG